MAARLVDILDECVGGGRRHGRTNDGLFCGGDHGGFSVNFQLTTRGLMSSTYELRRVLLVVVVVVLFYRLQ